MKNRSFWFKGPLTPKACKSTGRVPSGEMNWIGLGMHLFRQFERESLEVDRKGRKKKSEAGVTGNKCSEVYVKISSKKTLEGLTSLPLAGPRRRAHLKRVQRKSMNRLKHCPQKGRKAARLVRKRPVRARRLSLGGYQEKRNSLGVTNALRFELGSTGSRVYTSSWADRSFWLSELFPKLYARKVARSGFFGRKSRKVRRAGFAKRIRKSRRVIKKSLKAIRRRSVKDELPQTIREFCPHCHSSYGICAIVPNQCWEFLVWRRERRLGKYAEVDLELAIEKENVSMGSPLREVVDAEVPIPELVLEEPIRKPMLPLYPKRWEYVTSSSAAWLHEQRRNRSRSPD